MSRSKALISFALLALTACSSAKNVDSSSKSFKTARALYEIGKSQFGDRHFADAVSTFEQSLNLLPDQPDAKTYLALADMEMEKYKESEALMKELCQATPEDGDCWNNFAVLKLRESKPDEAIIYANKAIRSKGYTTPDLAFGNIAKAWSQKKNNILALENADKAIKIEPNSCDLRNLKTQALLRLKRLEESVQSAKLATMQCPINTTTLAWEAYALYRIGRHPQARDKFEYIVNEYHGSAIAEYAVKALEKIPDQVPVEEPPL